MPLPRFVSRTIHHEALDWATRASANGGVISTTTIRAVSDFCRNIDANGLRSSMYRLNLFAGGNLSGALVPLYRSTAFSGTVVGNATDTNVNFVSGDYAETGASGGLKGNGTTKYLDTGLLQSSLPANSTHMSISGTSLETSTASARVLCGLFNGGSNGTAILYAAMSRGRAFQHGVNSVDGPAISAPSSSESHLIGVRRSLTDAAIYSNGSVAATSSVSASSQNSSLSFYVFTANGYNNPSAARLRMYSIGIGITDAQAAAFSAAVAAFNTALGR